MVRLSLMQHEFCLPTQGQGEAYTRLRVGHTMSGAEHHRRESVRSQTPEPLSGAGCGLWQSLKDARLFAEYPDAPRVWWGRKKRQRGHCEPCNKSTEGKMPRIQRGNRASGHWSSALMKPLVCSSPWGQDGLEPLGIWVSKCEEGGAGPGGNRPGLTSIGTLGEWPKLNTLIFPLSCCPGQIKPWPGIYRLHENDQNHFRRGFPKTIFKR